MINFQTGLNLKVIKRRKFECHKESQEDLMKEVMSHIVTKCHQIIKMSQNKSHNMSLEVTMSHKSCDSCDLKSLIKVTEQTHPMSRVIFEFCNPLKSLNTVFC
jgi:hypothetical protein